MYLESAARRIGIYWKNNLFLLAEPAGKGIFLSRGTKNAKNRFKKQLWGTLKKIKTIAASITLQLLCNNSIFLLPGFVIGRSFLLVNAEYILFWVFKHFYCLYESYLSRKSYSKYFIKIWMRSATKYFFVMQ